MWFVLICRVDESICLNLCWTIGKGEKIGGKRSKNRVQTQVHKVQIKHRYHQNIGFQRTGHTMLYKLILMDTCHQRGGWGGLRLLVSVFYRRVLRVVSRGEWLQAGTRRDQNAMEQGTQGFRQIQANVA